MPQPEIVRDNLGRLTVYSWTDGFRLAQPKVNKVAPPTADLKDFFGPDEEVREVILSGMHLSPLTGFNPPIRR